MQDTCTTNGWTHPPSSSPLIWRELIDRGGKGVYMGGLEEFCAYSQHYYNIVPSTSDDLDSEIAAENLNAFNGISLERAQRMQVEPLHVCITNASSPLAYQVASRVLLNEVFGSRQILHLHLLDTSDCNESVQALVMELQDLAHHNLAHVSSTTSPHEAFKAVAAVFVLDEFSKAEEDSVRDHSPNNIRSGDQIFGTISHPSELNDMKTEEPPQQAAVDMVHSDEPQPSDNADKSYSTQSDSVPHTVSKGSPSTDTTIDCDLLQRASKTYYMYGGILDYTAQKDVRVIIVGPYSNLGAALMAKRVSSIDKHNFIASSGLVESQASSVIASKLGVSSADIQQVGVWGRSQGYQVLLDVACTQVSHFKGSVVGPDGFYLDIKKCLFDYKWLSKDFPRLALDRHNNTSSCYGDKARGVYLAEAVSMVKIMKDWWNGSNGWHSVGVVLDDDIAVSYPCVCNNGVWERQSGATLEEGRNEEFMKIVNTLRDEFEMALANVSSSSDKESHANTPASKL